MKLTVSIIAITAGTFAATLAFAPAIAKLSGSLNFATSLSEEAPVTVQEPRDCHTPLGMIVDALSEKECLQ